MAYRVPFGIIKIGGYARDNIAKVLDSGQLTEGPLAAEFEQKFAAKFGWKYAIATSSGTTAGEVIWAAIREIEVISSGLDDVITPACAFVSTANCILASGLNPKFVDIDLSTLNINPNNVEVNDRSIGLQFVATMGKLTPIKSVAEIAVKQDIWLVSDSCEAHGAKDAEQRADAYYADAAIYSLYPAHLIVGVEGGVICTDNKDLANLCRSIKSHGRPFGETYFDFERVGFNAKWSELHAAIALESLAFFDSVFIQRRQVRQELIRALERFEDDLILYRDEPGETIAPHAFPLVLRNDGETITGLYDWLKAKDIEVKTLFGSLPTDHAAFKFLRYRHGDFPVAERIGRTGLHFGCHEYMTEDDVKYIANAIERYFVKP